jgi:NADH dehydrogenase
MAMKNTHAAKVIVLGGGYAGIMSANRLAGTLKSNVEITMVNPIPEFVERVRLHEVAARPESQSATRHSIRSLLHPAVRLRIATVNRILPEQQSIYGVDSDSGVPWAERYDELVYAVGSGDENRTVPGVSEHAHSISSLSGAHELKRALDALPAGATVLTVGGGTTAIELVTEIAVARPLVKLKLATSSRIAPTLSPKARAYLQTAQAMKNVEIIEHSPVAEVTATGVTTRSGEEITADCVIWAASFAVPSLARDSGLEVDRAGRLVVDDFMRAPGHAHILGAGDSCVVTGTGGEHLRMACATAAPQGAHAASTISAALRGQTPQPFALAYLVVALSLGPGDGLVQKTRSDDTPANTILSGWFAAGFNELNNQYARLILAWERRRAGTYHWAKPTRSQAASRPSLE